MNNLILEITFIYINAKKNKESACNKENFNFEIYFQSKNKKVNW